MSRTNGRVEAPVLTEVARVVASARTLEELSRPLLAIMQRLTGLESTYVTRIDWDEGRQEIVFSLNAGSIEMNEGLQVEWRDTLCKRALEEGVSSASDVPDRWGDSAAARDLRLQTYVSVPIEGSGGTIFGTLCGASGDVHPVDESVIAILRLFAQVLADQIQREQALNQERERAAAAERRLRDRAEFLARGEHMLKTPLTVVVGWAETLEQGWATFDDEQVRRAVGIVAEHGRRLRDQVNALLEAARTEILTSELTLDVLNLRAEAEAAVQSFAGASPKHALSVEWGDERTHALADRTAVYQVLGHLLENAIKYSPEGGRILVRGRGAGDAVELAIEDEGPGLPEGVDVFAPFSRGGGAGDAKPGVGLGLHIVSQLVEAMNGSVEARNRDRGAVFVVRLPAA